MILLKSIVTAIVSFLVVSYLRMQGATVGRNVRFGLFPDIVLRDGASLKNFVIGDNVVFEGRLFLRMRASGRVVLEEGASVCTHVWLVTANKSELRLGSGTRVASYGVFNGGHGITIGRNCLFGCHAYFCSSDHEIKRDLPIHKQGHIGAPIVVEDGVWVGGRVSVNKGVRIGEGAVLGSGAVITKDAEPYGIYGGVPAKKIGERE